MSRRPPRLRVGSLATTLAVLLGGLAASAAEVQVRDRPADPHGTPRPARGATEVPLRTSLYVELGVTPRTDPDGVDPESVSLQITAEGEPARVLLAPGRSFKHGTSGWLRPTSNLQNEPSLAIYVETGRTLRPSTLHTVTIAARSQRGATLDAERGSWTFRTEAAGSVHAVVLPVDLARTPVTWRGGFFRGFGNVRFCTQAEEFGPTYDLMAEARKLHPRAWSLQRDFWMTGTEFRPPGFNAFDLPNIVHQRETRRITALASDPDGTRITVEDVFGATQYGVTPNRPLSDDFHPGDSVLIADGVHDGVARVVGVDEPAHVVRVAPAIPNPPDGSWRIAYDGPLPTRSDPDKPGLFASGGCYLRKQNPHGTPAYFWGRLDKEWDLAHRQYGRRLLPNFTDAAGDLSRDGRSWTMPTDLVQWRDVCRDLAGHVIDRYGADALSFPWSVFNEPDLGPLFWRADWSDLQRFYDYTVDGILRAFEDRGFDSNRVFVGGLELGGIFGTNLKLNEFLAHCSPNPRALADGALPRNAVVADPRLDGRRSRRVEALCERSGGKGSPCDFVSIHAYNRSEGMAAKLIRAKEMALAVDPVYYEKLWINSHESCPDWLPPPDEAASDSYLGNGYFAAWAVDVARRLLVRAADDPRYGYGESILTVWPPSRNVTGLNAVTRVLLVDDGDGRAGHKVTIPDPIFHVFNLLSDLDDQFWVLPERHAGGHVVGGFATWDGSAYRVAVVAHAAHDTQSRSDQEFAVSVDLSGLPPGKLVQVTEHRFDRDHNSALTLARELRNRLASFQAPSATLDPLLDRLRRADRPGTQRAALREFATLGPAARPVLADLFRQVGALTDPTLRAEGEATLARVAEEPGLPARDVEKWRRISELQPSLMPALQVDRAGRVSIPTRLLGNGVVFLEIRSGEDR